MVEINPKGTLPPVNFDHLAIIGMDALFGEMDGLAAFEHALITGAQHTRLSQDFSTDIAEVEPLLLDSAERSLSPEDFLLLKVGWRALQDANFKKKGNAFPRTAFIFVRGSELVAAVSSPAETSGAGFQPGAPVEKICNLSGPFINLSVDVNPLATALHQAQNLLYLGIVDAVLIASAILAQDFDRLLKNGAGRLNTAIQTLGFDSRVDGWTSGEGASALLLARYDTALNSNHRIYAVLDALAYTARNSPTSKKNIFPTLLSSDTILQSCQQTFLQAALEPAQIGYLEVLGSGFAPIDAAEITGISKAYKTSLPAGPDLNVALGSVQSNVGHLYTASALAAIIKSALCLYHRFIPGTPGWSGPKKTELWKDTPFYVPADTRTWFLPAGQSKRYAAVNSIGLDGSCAHLILAEEPSQQNRPNSYLAQTSFYLFPLAGDSAQELSAHLEQLKQTLSLTGDLRSAAIDSFKAYQSHLNAKYLLSIVGHDRPEIQREIEYAARDLFEVFEKKKTWQTPQGSYLTTDPAGLQGGVAFVYPGAFNTYTGIGRELFLLFPQLYERVVGLTSDLGQTIQERLVYPRSLEALSREQSELLESKLNNDPIAMIVSGSLMAVLFTIILRDIFKVQPDAAFGYSLGEIAMLFGMGVWDEADQTSARLSASTLFRTRLSGAQNAVREYWGMSAENDAPPGNRLWNNYFLMAPAEKVAEAINNRQRLYLTHINTPRQVVIGGAQAACQSLIADLKCNALKAPFDFALHCDAMRSEYGSLVNLLSWPVAEKSRTPLYTAADDRPLPMDSQAIAGKIAAMLCSCLDFPKLIQQVYADGARVFIELGANSNCSKWIDDTLKEKPHLAASINRKGAEDDASIVRLLAKLASHRVPVDLSALYRSER